MTDKESLKKIEKYYNKRASGSDGFKAAGQWIEKEIIPEICTEICKKIELTDKKKVLEIGCGSGVLGGWIKERCKDYVGLDISVQMLKKFKEETMDKRNLNIFQAITNSIPVEDNIFDIVLMNGVSMYFKNNKELENTLKEMNRVVKNNGIIFIGENIVPNGIYWELVWFQNLSNLGQFFAMPYVKFRRNLAKKSPKMAGKWKSMHNEISVNFLKSFYKNKAELVESNAAAQTIRRKKISNKYKGNHRKDFVIKLIGVE